MKATLKPDFILHSIANEKVLIGAGQQIDFSKMLMLNDTAAWIIAELQKHPATPEELTLRLTEIYDVSQEEAQNDIEELLRHLEEQGIVIIEE
ncbi:PqqD family protein [Bacteroides clarus]|uniref:PqqD family protein n=1 Tax=Bacteroides clarus TaxID=626929 RepID=UPI003FF0BDED